MATSPLFFFPSLISTAQIRKLEFLLAEALEQGCDSVVTCGSIQSNHARATAMASRQLGLQPHLILRWKGEMVCVPYILLFLFFHFSCFFLHDYVQFCWFFSLFLHFHFIYPVSLSRFSQHSSNCCHVGSFLCTLLPSYPFNKILSPLLSLIFYCSIYSFLSAS